jgi:hypothetical protein
MKGLFVIIGESFRSGNQGSRIRGLPESYDEQIKASHSHIYFLNGIQEKYDIDIAVSISSYNTIYNNDLIDIYKPYLIFNIMFDDPIGLDNLFYNCIKDIDYSTFDFIFYFRIDIFIKPRMIDVFIPTSSIILYPCICFIPFHKTKEGHPRVNDTMMFIPKKYYSYISQIKIHHHSWSNLIKSNILTYNDLDVMINTYHDSDTFKDLNPLYYIVNREESKIWKSEGKYFNKHNFKNIKKI